MPTYNCPWCPQKFRNYSYYLRHIMGHREIPVEDRVKESNIVREKIGLPLLEVSRSSEVKKGSPT